MSTTSEHQAADHVLGRSKEEAERLGTQARVWEAATGRLFDRIELGRGARCLDAGCGSGETMRLIAQRVGPAGHVCGIDVDVELGREALEMLHGAGHRQCAFAPVDLEVDEPIPGAAYDLRTTDGRLEPLRTAGAMIDAVSRSLLPAAVSLGLTTADDGERRGEDFARDPDDRGEHSTLWPLLIGAWERKPPEDA